MFAKILVPLDGSDLARKALPHAAFLAKVAGGHLVLLRAVRTWASTPHEAIERELDQKPEIEAELQAEVRRLAADQVSAEALVLPGEPASIIDGVAKSHDLDLIVMSTHGRGGLARWAYGSVAERVLRLASRPLLLVPAHCEHEWVHGRKSTVLVPLDGSPLAEEALVPAKELARALDANLSLVQVIEPPPAVAYEVPAGYGYLNVEEWVEQAKPYLTDWAKRLGSDGWAVDTDTLVGYAAATIAELAEAEQAAAIVMATHGRSGVARVVLGSVALGVVQRASMPVLVLRPAALSA